MDTVMANRYKDPEFLKKGEQDAANAKAMRDRERVAEARAARGGDETKGRVSSVTDFTRPEGPDELLRP